MSKRVGGRGRKGGREGARRVGHTSAKTAPCSLSQGRMTEEVADEEEGPSLRPCAWIEEEACESQHD